MNRQTRPIEIHSTRGGAASRGRRNGELTKVADLARDMDLPCAGQCPALDKLLGSYTLSSASDIIREGLVRHTNCSGPTKKFMGRVGCNK